MCSPLGSDSTVDIMQEDAAPDWESALVLATLVISLSVLHIYL
jgi:hypothetical protein